MNNQRFGFYFIAAFFLFTCCNLFAQTQEEMLQEHSKWVKILGLQGLNSDPVKVSKAWGEPYRQKENIVFVRGNGVSLTFDTKTQELIEAYHYYQGAIRAKAEDEGKKTAFSLDKEFCKKELIKYYKLITEEEPPPDFEIKLPSVGSLLKPTQGIGRRWQRTYKGYVVRDNYIQISLFADDGTFQGYAKRYIYDMPETVEVKVTKDVARQKAIEIADKEIRGWVRFLDSLESETAIRQLGDLGRGLESKGMQESLKKESQKYASLFSCKPEELTPPYLEIVNMNNVFTGKYWQPNPNYWNPTARLSWIINLGYLNAETKANATFEIFIDANDGSLVGGSKSF